MKQQKETRLDVDFIGGQGSLTKEEEQAISKFFRAEKERIKLKKSLTKALKEVEQIKQGKRKGKNIEDLIRKLKKK